MSSNSDFKPPARGPVKEQSGDVPQPTAGTSNALSKPVRRRWGLGVLLKWTLVLLLVWTAAVVTGIVFSAPDRALIETEFNAVANRANIDNAAPGPNLAPVSGFCRETQGDRNRTAGWVSRGISLTPISTAWSNP